MKYMRVLHSSMKENYFLTCQNKIQNLRIVCLHFGFPKEDWNYSYWDWKNCSLDRCVVQWVNSRHWTRRQQEGSEWPAPYRFTCSFSQQGVTNKQPSPDTVKCQQLVSVISWLSWHGRLLFLERNIDQSTHQTLYGECNANSATDEDGFVAISQREKEQIEQCPINRTGSRRTHCSTDHSDWQRILGAPLATGSSSTITGVSGSLSVMWVKNNCGCIILHDIMPSTWMSV